MNFCCRLLLFTAHLSLWVDVCIHPSNELSGRKRAKEASQELIFFVFVFDMLRIGEANIVQTCFPIDVLTITIAYIFLRKSFSSWSE